MPSQERAGIVDGQRLVNVDGNKLRSSAFIGRHHEAYATPLHRQIVNARPEKTKRASWLFFSADTTPH
jgi:hypothetical protein